MTSTTKKREANLLVERSGVNAVEGIFVNQFGWVFREQHESDWGVDAQVEVVRDGVPTGLLFALQIKAGASYFKKGRSGYMFRGKLRHLDYWHNHSLPVLLVLTHPESGVAVCQLAGRRVARMTPKSWSVEVPAENLLTPQLKPFLLAALLSNAHSLDVPYRSFLSHIETLESPRLFLKEAKEHKRSILEDSWACDMFTLLQQQVASDAELVTFFVNSDEADPLILEPGHEQQLREGQIGIRLLPSIGIHGGFSDSHVPEEVRPYTVARHGFLELLEYLLKNQELVQSRRIIILPERFRYSWESYPDGGGEESIDAEQILKRIKKHRGRWARHRGWIDPSPT